MREYSEPTCANFLREPLVLGVGLLPLLMLVFLLAALQVLGLNRTAIALAVVGYVGLRLQEQFAKNGSEEALVFLLERKFASIRPIIAAGIPIRFLSPDTLDREDQLFEKNLLEDHL